MPYCSKCGIKVSDKKESCPLCFTPIQKIDEIAEPSLPAYPQKGRTQRMTSKERLFFIWLPIAIALLSALLIVLVINLMQGSMSWSRYPVVALSTAIVMITFGFLFHKRPKLLVCCNTAAIAGLLWLLDSFTGPPMWFLPLGLPIVIPFAFFLIHSIHDAEKLQKSISSLFLRCALLLTVFFPYLEMLIIRFNGKGALSWSLIVSIVFGAISTILIIYILYFKKRFDISRYFHT